MISSISISMCQFNNYIPINYPNSIEYSIVDSIDLMNIKSDSYLPTDKRLKLQ